MAEWLSWQGVRQVLVLVALAAAGVVAGRLLVLVLEDRASSPHPEGPAAVTPARESPSVPVQARPPSGVAVRAAEALQGWDAARAAAYARGDPAALRRLYVPGSRAGLRDVRVLQAYVDRGLVVRGLRMQVLGLRVLASDPGRVRLEVTDRRVGGLAVGRGVRARLPDDAPTTRVLVLRSGAGAGAEAGPGPGDWRVASVHEG